MEPRWKNFLTNKYSDYCTLDIDNANVPYVHRNPQIHLY